MNHDFQHLNNKAQKARTAIALTMVCNCLSVVLGVLLLRITEMGFTTAAYLSQMMLVLMIQGVDLVCQLLAGIFFLTWQTAAIKNARILNPQTMKTSTAMAVWAWFLPIFCMFKPYFVMKEIWTATLNRPDESGTTAPLEQPIRNTLLTWWLMWLLPTMVGSFVSAAFEASKIHGAANFIQPIFRIFGILVSGFLIMRIITRISMDQDRAFAQRQLEEPPVVAPTHGAPNADQPKEATSELSPNTIEDPVARTV